MADAMIEIDKDVPIPSPKGGYRVYPFDDLEIGDSFAVPLKQASIVRQAMSLEHRRNERRYLSRIVDNSCRIWRIR